MHGAGRHRHPAWQGNGRNRRGRDGRLRPRGRAAADEGQEPGYSAFAWKVLQAPSWPDAIPRWQVAQGLVGDGVIGPKTLAALGLPA